MSQTDCELIRRCKNIRKCRNKSDTNLLKCSLCVTNWIHKECHDSLCSEDGVGDVLINTPVCGKRCLNRVIRGKAAASREEPKRAFWHNDGPTDNINSLSVLIDWLTKEGNYTKWKGGNKYSGVSKNTLASQIVQEMARNGIKTERSGRDVVQKILIMEQNFRKAVDFLDGTGAGITDEESLTAAVKKICPYYYELESVMCERHSSRPLAAEDELKYNFIDSDNIQMVRLDVELEENSSNVELEENSGNDTLLSPTNSTSSKRSLRHLTIQGKRRKKHVTEESTVGNLQHLKREQMDMDNKHKSMDADIRCREVTARENEVRSKEKVDDTNILLMDANIQKAEVEAEKIAEEIKKTAEEIKKTAAEAKKTAAEAELATIEAKAKLLMKRAELLKAGVLQVDIDLLLPLPANAANIGNS